MKRNLLLIGLLLTALPLMGPTCPGDDDDSSEAPPEATPEDVGALIKDIAAISVMAIDLTEKAATIDNEPQFTPCMIAQGSKGGIAIAESNVDAVVSEATTPDGKLHLNGGPVDFSRCMDMAGKPDPWPPTEPNKDIEDTIKMFVPAGVLAAKTIIKPKLPDTGQECINGTVALAMMESISQVVTTTVIDAVNGAPGTTIPEFDVNYSGCGLDIEEPPAEEPAETTPSE
jgi:hypothetical protein